MKSVQCATVSNFKHVRPIAMEQNEMLFKFRFERVNKKAPLKRGFFIRAMRSTAKPGIYRLGAVLFFPGLEATVVATLGFDQLASVRVLVDLDHARDAVWEPRRHWTCPGLDQGSG